MFKDLGTIEFKNGETVQSGIVIGPDTDWAPEVEKMLQHKGDPWNWQNSELLRRKTGCESRFFILHRGGIPFANVLVAEINGTGLFGHVWTEPEDRRKGASSFLIKTLMKDFAQRGGKAMYLGTGYDSPPYHLYKRNGFEGVETGSGYMNWFADNQEEFEKTWFAQGTAVIEPVSWRHWPAAPALFLGGFPGMVRCMPYNLVGRSSTEGPVISAILREKESPNSTVMLTVNETSAVAGMAACTPHSMWPKAVTVDVYTHPGFSDHAEELLNTLSLPEADRYLAYSDSEQPEKGDILKAAGFTETAVFKNRLKKVTGETLDVVEWERS